MNRIALLFSVAVLLVVAACGDDPVKKDLTGPAKPTAAVAVVPPEERAAAASMTNVPRSLTSALSPLLAGVLTAQPPVDLWMGIVLIVSLATVGSLLAARTARERFPIARQPNAERLPAPLWIGVPIVGITGLLWDGALPLADG